LDIYLSLYQYSIDSKHFFMKSRQEILALLRDFKIRQAEKYGILRMDVFGSVARDQQTESSDVDIYYEGEAQGFLSLPFEKRIGRTAGKSGGYRPS
jgi:hypothetical protein